MKPIVLIVEDNIILAFELADMVKDELHAEPVVVSKVAEALEIDPESLAFAFLDINVMDGKTYPVARSLLKSSVPFIFVSGNDIISLPADLIDMPFFSKPALKEPLMKMTRSLSNVFN
jgi:two-component SAPR family response regulator